MLYSENLFHNSIHWLLNLWIKLQNGFNILVKCFTLYSCFYSLASPFSYECAPQTLESVYPRRSSANQRKAKTWKNFEFFRNVYVFFFFFLQFNFWGWNVLHNLEEPWPNHDPLTRLDFGVSPADASKQRVRCCRKCSQMKLPRCHHCSICGRCIEDGPSLCLGCELCWGFELQIFPYFLVLHVSWNKPWDVIITTTFYSYHYYHIL